MSHHRADGRAASRSEETEHETHGGVSEPVTSFGSEIFERPAPAPAADVSAIIGSNFTVTPAVETLSRASVEARNFVPQISTLPPAPIAVDRTADFNRRIAPPQTASIEINEHLAPKQLVAKEIDSATLTKRVSAHEPALLTSVRPLPATDTPTPRISTERADSLTRRGEAQTIGLDPGAIDKNLIDKSAIKGSGYNPVPIESQVQNYKVSGFDPGAIEKKGPETIPPSAILSTPRIDQGMMRNPVDQISESKYNDSKFFESKGDNFKINPALGREIGSNFIQDPAFQESKGSIVSNPLKLGGGTYGEEKLHPGQGLSALDQAIVNNKSLTAEKFGANVNPMPLLADQRQIADLRTMESHLTGNERLFVEKKGSELIAERSNLTSIADNRSLIQAERPSLTAERSLAAAGFGVEKSALPGEKISSTLGERSVALAQPAVLTPSAIKMATTEVAPVSEHFGPRTGTTETAMAASLARLHNVESAARAVLSSTSAITSVRDNVASVPAALNSDAVRTKPAPAAEALNITLAAVKAVLPVQPERLPVEPLLSKSAMAMPTATLSDRVAPLASERGLAAGVTLAAANAVLAANNGERIATVNARSLNAGAEVVTIGSNTIMPAAKTEAAALTALTALRTPSVCAEHALSTLDASTTAALKTASLAIERSLTAGVHAASFNVVLTGDRSAGALLTATERGAKQLTTDKVVTTLPNGEKVIVVQAAGDRSNGSVAARSLTAVPQAAGVVRDFSPISTSLREPLSTDKTPLQIGIAADKSLIVGAKVITLKPLHEISESDKRYLTGIELLVGIAALAAIARARAVEGREGGEDGEDEAEGSDEQLQTQDDQDYDAKSIVRPKYMVQPGDSLTSIAEEFYHDAHLGWLIMHLNKGRLTDTWQGDICYVEVSGRQELDLPVKEDIIHFYKTAASKLNSKRLVTTVRQSQIDQELVTLAFHNVVGRRGLRNAM